MHAHRIVHRLVLRAEQAMSQIQVKIARTPQNIPVTSVALMGFANMRSVLVCKERLLCAQCPHRTCVQPLSLKARLFVVLTIYMHFPKPILAFVCLLSAANAV